MLRSRTRTTWIQRAHLSRMIRANSRADRMPAHLRRARLGTFEVRCIALHQVARALKALNRDHLTDAAVHTARKQLKRARASLRLLRYALSEAVYRRENIALRDAARRVSAIRDCKTLLETLEKLVSSRKVRSRFESGAEFRTVLQANYTEARRDVLQPSALRSTREMLARLLDRGPRWRVASDGWSVLGRGWKRVYAGGRRARLRVQRHRTTENLHEWRKQVKYLWHQFEVLEPLRPGLVRELADQAHKLGDYLGDDHDLVVLREHVAMHPEAFPNSEARDALLVLIDRRRAKLQDKALVLGRRLYKTRPNVLGLRLATKYRHQGDRKWADQRSP